MKYMLCDDPWGEEEKRAIESVMHSGMYTMGKNVAAYEKQFADKYGVAHAVMTSSGSAANLLAIAALAYSGRVARGSEVIVPAVSWSTTYAPLEQYGMRLVFVDIDPDTLNMSTDHLKRALTPDTKMIFAVNLLGNSNEYAAITALCKEKGILLLEDNCESLGAKYNGRSLGTIGLMGTYSTFYSHHMCTMEGGVVVTDDDELYEYMLSLRAHGWTRNLPESGRIYQKNRNPFYESYHFILPGFNLRPIEMEGAIGIAQLRKIDGMIAQRRRNAAYFLEKMQRYPEIRTQKEIGESSWFGFSMVLSEGLADKRDALVERLGRSDIECRPIVAGNFTRNPVIRYMDHFIPEELRNADDIHDHGFFIGNHSSDNRREIDYFITVLDKALTEVC